MTTELPREIQHLIDDAQRDEEGLIELRDVVRALAQLAERISGKPEYLIAAGMLSFEAMRRLRAWSDDVAARAEAHEERRKGAFSALDETPWAQMVRDSMNREKRETNRRLRAGAADALVPRLRTAPARRVTVDDLVALLGETLARAETRVAHQRAIETRREEYRLARAGSLQMLHEDDDQADIELLRKRITEQPGAPLRALARNRDELVRLLDAALRLARTNEISLEQTDFPAGPIQLRKIET